MYARGPACVREILLMKLACGGELINSKIVIHA